MVSLIPLPPWEGPVPPKVHVGETYDLVWSNNQTYTLELLLVQGHGPNRENWSPVKTFFSGLTTAAGNGTYEWTVPNVGHRGASYALWLSGQDPLPATGGYANLTNWFTIEGGSAIDLSAGQIAGTVVGIVAALSLAAAAAFFFLRTRRSRKGQQIESDESPERESLDSIMDAKTKAHLAMKEMEVAN